MKEELIPHSVDAEEAVISSLLIDGDKMTEVIAILAPQDFLTSQCKWAYEACCYLYEQRQGINQISLADELMKQGRLGEIGGAAYLNQLIAQCPTSELAGDYAKIVKSHSVSRNFISTGNEIMALGYGNGEPTDNISKALELLQGIHLPKDKATSAYDLARVAIDHYGTLRAQSAGLATGLRGIDEQLGGLLKGESVVLCGNTSVGKTSLAIQIVRNVSRDNKVFIASEEMTRQDIINKMVAQISGVHSELIALGNYPDDRLDRMVVALGTISALRFKVDKINTTSMLRSAIDEYKPALVIVDYLQKLRDKTHEKDVQRISFIAHELTGMAKDYNIPIVVLSQLHRDMEEKKNKRPRLSDLRGSGEIEEAFDTVWGLWRESYAAFLDNKEAQGDTTELWILKNRLRGNRVKIILEWDKNYECYKN